MPFDRGELSVDYGLRQYVWSADDPERFVQQWHVQAEARATGADGDVDGPTLEVARAELVRVDLDRVEGAGANAYDLLDAESGDLETIAHHVFDIESGQLHEDLERTLVEGFTAGILILDQVWVAPGYRGHELGPLVAAFALEALRSGCGLALCFPSPFENRPTDDAERAEVVAHLSRVWAKVGFEPYGNTGVHFLDLGATTLSGCLARLSRTAGAI